jgi:hypothetical protein
MTEASDTRHIPADTLRALIARSGGYCQNPKCNRDLFPFLADGTYKNIKEAAHIIPFSSEGPRGNEKRSDDPHNFANIILFCPTCHTLADKFPERYPAAMLREWKTNHEHRLCQCFGAPTFKSRRDLRQAILPLFRENKMCWTTYGPECSLKDSLLTDAQEMWTQAVLKTILPNNRRLLAILRANTHLLTEQDLDLVEQFAIHKDGLEYNYLSGDKNSSVPRFPTNLTCIGKEEDHA